MQLKNWFITAALAVSCQNETLPLLEKLVLPKSEPYVVKVLPEPVQEKSQPRGEECVIDLSDHFIPELLSLSRDAEQYFITEGILQNPFQRERFGIFSSFEHHQKLFEHYVKALKQRRAQEQPKITLKFVPYTTEKTLKRIASLETEIKENKLNPKQLKQHQQELENLRMQVETIKNIQQVLQWEGFYPGDITGIYEAKTASAVMKYQRFYQQQLRYNWKIESKVNSFTRQLLNKDFEEYAFAGVKRVLEERIFHTKCKGRYPYVIEQAELEKLVDSAATQLKLDTLEGVQEFISHQHDTATVYLEIPERYTQDSMRLEVDVEKWDSGKYKRFRTRTKLRLYALEEGKKVELLQTKAVVGGWVKNKKTGKEKEYHTPEREFYLKHVTIMPHWNPPEWAEEEEEVKEEEKIPGPFNAFGMLNTPLYYDNKPQKNPFLGWQDGDNGYRIHLTPWPSSVENGGASHGCIRIHPTMSRFFYFLIGYTPHNIVLENNQLKFTAPKGSFIPFEPGHYIKVRTCEQKCE